MSFLSLHSHSVRNLEDFSLSFNEKLNVVYGENGSGKTSFLESLYLLATARSFRTRKPSNIIRTSTPNEPITVFGKIYNKHNQCIKVGVRKSLQGGTDIKVDQRIERSASALAQEIAVLIIEPNSFSLIDSSAKARRQYLDWGVFHVEHSFAQLWASYTRCLKQRNSLLKKSKLDYSDIASWDDQLAKLATNIAEIRLGYFQTLKEQLVNVINDVYPELQGDLEIDYYRGWDNAKDLSEILRSQFNIDHKRKHTQHGAHRADIKILVERKPAFEILSRGQQKKLIISMYLAHVRTLRLLKEYRSVVLIDDITAELDSINTKKVVRYLLNLEAQIFCTLLDIQMMPDVLDGNDGNYFMFHVEHGKITKI